jgi:flagellar biosynthesis protein FlhB
VHVPVAAPLTIVAAGGRVTRSFDVPLVVVLVLVVLVLVVFVEVFPLFALELLPLLALLLFLLPIKWTLFYIKQCPL